MSARTSDFIWLAHMSARRNIEENPERARNVVLNAIFKYEKTIEALAQYNCDPLLHKEHNNAHSAAISIGCGCVLCRVRHEYAKLKVSKHRFKKAFNEDSNGYFTDLYQKSKIVKRDNLTEYGFYNYTMEEFENKISELKLRLESIKDTYHYYLG